MWLSILRQIVFAAVLNVCFRVSAAEWSSTNAGVSFVLPSAPTWQQAKPVRSEAKLVLEDTKGTAMVFFAAFEKKLEEKDYTEKLAQEWETGYFRKSKARKISGEFFDFKGKHAYKVVDEEITSEGTERHVAIIWLNDGRTCEIVASKVNADPLQDPVIKAFVDSTVFLQKTAP